MNRSTLRAGAATRHLAVLLLLVLALALPAAASLPGNRLVLDWATYNPASLVLREFGWLEEEFAPDGIQVEWVFSVGSAAANEALRSRAVHFAATAGIAALNARAQGTPLISIYIYSQPEWTAIVVPPDSPLESVADLEGKRVAAFVGTDPWFFLLRAIQGHGLPVRAVNVLNIPHPEGRTALERGDIAAWAGLDPIMGDLLVSRGYRLLYRNPDLNTWGTLNVLESFAAEHPDIVRRVLARYEQARRWAVENPEGTIDLLAKAAGISRSVAEDVLRERTAFPHPVPDERVYNTLAGTVPLLREIPNNLAPWADVERALNTLLVPVFIEDVLAAQPN